MTPLRPLRPGEIAVEVPPPNDAQLYFIGRIYTPWTDRADCPRQGWHDGPICRIEIFEPWVQALDGIAEFDRLEVLYWMHLARRDVVKQSPRDNLRGTFSLRSPVRPNPIATQLVARVAIEGASVLVRGLDCLDGTMLLDLKPDRCFFSPVAEPRGAEPRKAEPGGAEPRGTEPRA